MRLNPFFPPHDSSEDILLMFVLFPLSVWYCVARLPRRKLVSYFSSVMIYHTTRIQTHPHTLTYTTVCVSPFSCHLFSPFPTPSHCSLHLIPFVPLSLSYSSFLLHFITFLFPLFYPRFPLSPLLSLTRVFHISLFFSLFNLPSAHTQGQIIILIKSPYATLLSSL